ncbi:MAG TPA: hypothetical protein VK604_19355 [Bryobacteraceae bacterium]|nr:hypothetical protein [Bryobacteraceae bacterium]
MGVIFQVLYRTVVDGKRIVGPITYNRVAQLAPTLANIGVTVVQFPPPAKTQSGAANNADGYGLFDPYDLGSKDQCYSVPTYFGSAEELRRAIAILAAWGIQSYIDYVFHQYNGGRNTTYKYLGSDGKTLNGRFSKTPSCFVGAPPRVPVDSVFDTEGNFGFGDMCSFTHDQPPHYMANGTIANFLWMKKTLGFHGVRLDNTKGTNVAFTRRLLNEACGGIFTYGECFTGNPAELQRWINLMDGKAATVDFTLHWALQNMCDSNASMRQMNGAGLAALNPSRAVTFKDNPDTDTSGGQQIVNNGLLAYAYLLTTEGYPCIYYRDWSSDPHCYGLKNGIDNLIWIHEVLANGPTTTRFLDNRVFCYERTGYPGLLTAINTDTYNNRKITVQTAFGPHCHLHEYTGKYEDVWTDGEGKVTFTVPCNAYNRGRSYLCFSRDGQSKQIKLQPFPIHQTFYGAEDLDIGPAVFGAISPVAQIYCAGKHTVTIKPAAASRSLSFWLEDQSGARVPQAAHGTAFQCFVPTDGMYTLMVSNWGTATVPFQAAVTYLAPKRLPAAVTAKTEERHVEQHAEIKALVKQREQTFIDPVVS